MNLRYLNESQLSVTHPNGRDFRYPNEIRLSVTRMKAVGSHREPSSYVFLASCNVLLHEAASGATLSFLLLYRINSAAVLLARLSYKADSAPSLFLTTISPGTRSSASIS